MKPPAQLSVPFTLSLSLLWNSLLPLTTHAQPPLNLTDRQIETRVQQAIPNVRAVLQKGEKLQQREQGPEFQQSQQALNTYRKIWQQKLNNSTVPEMLGHWMGPFGYAVTVFPTQTPDRVCLEFADEEDTGVLVLQVRGDKLLQTQSDKRTTIYTRVDDAFAELYESKETNNFIVWPYAKMPRAAKLHQAAYLKHGCITETNPQTLRAKSLDELLAQNKVCVSSYQAVRNPAGSQEVVVRSEPSVSSPISGVIRSGVFVQTYEDDSHPGWININGPNNVTGWMPEKYLLQPRKTPFSNQMRIRTLDGDPLNVRVSSNPGDRIVGAIPNGTIVTVQAYEGYRAKIKTPQNLTGYVVTQYLDCP